MRDKHGHAKHDEHGGQSKAYVIWRAMKSRCYNKNCHAYPDYGGRGIFVCARWRRFPLFLEDMGFPPDGMSIDRIDNDGPYSPDNCRWATPKEQARNRRGLHMLTASGQTKPMYQWSEETGISISTLWARVSKYGWSDEKAIRTPIRRSVRWHKSERVDVPGWVRGMAAA